ncbi:MAG TPA: hypothetical protein ENJ82_11675, partial [Bacteroidetes bacterium]|nr:hypothetical protein [Bacteroidota bacterium]
MGILRFILLLLILGNGIAGWSQQLPVAPANSPIVTAIESLNLEKAALLALREPNTKLKLYYQVRIMFIRYLINSSPENLSEFLATSKSNIQALQSLAKTDPQKDV